MVKLLLEDERERLKIAQDHEGETQRNQHIGTIAGVLKEHTGDVVAAFKLATEEYKASSGAKTTASEPSVYRCGDCNTTFSPPAGWTGEPIKCACGRIYTKEELLA